MWKAKKSKKTSDRLEGLRILREKEYNETIKNYKKKVKKPSVVTCDIKPSAVTRDAP